MSDDDSPFERFTVPNVLQLGRTGRSNYIPPPRSKPSFKDVNNYAYAVVRSIENMKEITWNAMLYFWFHADTPLRSAAITIMINEELMLTKFLSIVTGLRERFLSYESAKPLISLILYYPGQIEIIEEVILDFLDILKDAAKFGTYRYYRLEPKIEPESTVFYNVGDWEDPRMTALVEYSLHRPNTSYDKKAREYVVKNQPIEGTKMAYVSNALYDVMKVIYTVFKQKSMRDIDDYLDVLSDYLDTFEDDTRSALKQLSRDILEMRSPERLGMESEYSSPPFGVIGERPVAPRTGEKRKVKKSYIVEQLTGHYPNERTVIQVSPTRQSPQQSSDEDDGARGGIENPDFDDSSLTIGGPLEYEESSDDGNVSNKYSKSVMTHRKRPATFQEVATVPPACKRPHH